jgi:hypothetical protein
MAPINSEYLQYDPENDNLFPTLGCNIQQIASHAQGINGLRQQLAYVDGCLRKLWNDYSEKDNLAAGRAFESLGAIATRLKFKIQLGEVGINTTPASTAEPVKGAQKRISSFSEIAVIEEIAPAFLMRIRFNCDKPAFDLTPQTFEHCSRKTKKGTTPTLRWGVFLKALCGEEVTSKDRHNINEAFRHTLGLPKSESAFDESGKIKIPFKPKRPGTYRQKKFHDYSTE